MTSFLLIYVKFSLSDTSMNISLQHGYFKSSTRFVIIIKTHYHGFSLKDTERVCVEGLFWCHLFHK